ncbi:MAG: 2-oxo acid dehydrogenase subunit E2 [Bacteroidales bacterium]|nr:2-oxo acid dehydrogenase subunit E2 [Bacteroidales bacterium]
MATPVIMPRQGQSVETCIITQWLRKKGDVVKKGEILFSYETDKAAFEEEAPVDGTLLEIFYGEGDEVPVLNNVAVIGKEGESTAEFSPSDQKQHVEKHTQPASEPEGETKIQGAKTEEKTKTTESKPEPVSFTTQAEIHVSPRAKSLAERLGVPYMQISGTGPGGRIIERDIENHAKSGGKLTGMAYERASSEGLSAPASGSGIGGRVLASELSQQAVPADDFKMKKVTNIRRIIAENMYASLQNSAQLTHHMGADARRLLEYRAMIKPGAEAGEMPNITLNDMICYGVIKALKKMPEANAHFLGDQIKVFRKVHLGVAIDTERGLMVPALRNADDLSIEELSISLKKLTDSCRKGNVDPELLASTAATFTVSNLGALGVEMFTPVINLPQVGILGVNTIIQRPADVGNGIIGFVPYLGLSLTYDHRALDGAPASVFLREVKLQIENIELNIE